MTAVDVPPRLHPTLASLIPPKPARPSVRSLRFHASLVLASIRAPTVRPALIVSDIHLLTDRLPHLHTITATLSPSFYSCAGGTLLLLLRPPLLVALHFLSSARYPYLSNFGIYIIYMSISRLGHMHLRMRWLVSVRVCCCIVTALADPDSIVLSFSALLSARESVRACVCAKVEKVRILVGVQHRLYIVIAIRSVPTQGCGVVSGETA